MLFLSQLPNEVQLSILQDALEPVVGASFCDERVRMVRNRDVLRDLVLVCQLWRSVGTPLLYEQVVFSDLALPGPTRDGPGAEIAQELWSRQAAFLRTIRSSPNLASLIRGLHYEPPPIIHSGVPLPAIWSELGALPNLESLSNLSYWPELTVSPGPKTRLRQLHVHLPPHYKSRAYPNGGLSDLFNLSALSRLDNCFSGIEPDSTLLPALLTATCLPSLADFRLRVSLADHTVSDERLLHNGLRSFGRQLETLHLHVTSHGPVPGADWPFALRAHCPNLVKLAFDAVSCHHPNAGRPPKVNRTAPRRSGVPSRIMFTSDHGPPMTASDRLNDITECLPHWLDDQIDFLRPRLIILADVDSATWTAEEQTVGSAIARDIFERLGRQILTEDRFRRLIAPAAASS